ncbi:MAG: GNAT family N-acetyltransferase [Coriobacteriaceae bacterium]|jgi:GNAT superfamily N-acetyltransferase|nr:GNAT family N-acetyltransferase [Coriobacteriaceae bacterium]
MGGKKTEVIMEEEVEEEMEVEEEVEVEEEMPMAQNQTQTQPEHQDPGLKPSRQVLDYRPVATDADIARLALMADHIWHEYWPALLEEAQIDYMVERFQSVEAITRDIREKGYEYWILEHDGQVVGYTGGQGEDATAETGTIPQNPSDATDDGSGECQTQGVRFFISKIYLYREDRGKGYASDVIRFYEGLCRARGMGSMYLTVNKYNELGIRAYRAKGFQTIDSVVTDIGQGFVMDDYIMEKAVDPLD